MSAHFRELRQLLSEALGVEEFDKISIDEAKPIKRLLALRTIVHNPEESNASIQEEHVNGVLQVICNDVLQYCLKKDKNNQTFLMRSSENSGSTSKLRNVDEVIDEDEVRLLWKFLSTFTEDEDMMALIDRSATKAAVQLHYTITRPKQLDMFVHISATEMFFIDGDSLLMAALSSQQVDWDLMQPLHVLYNAQVLLHRMQRRGAHFHVIFFERTLWFWSKSPQKMFIRENLRETLTAVSESNPSAGLVVKTFESYHCKAFEEYVKHHEPEFFLISDGEQLGSPGPLHKMFDNGDLTLEEAKELKRPYRSIVDDEALGDNVSFYYHCFQTWAMARRITVAYSSRIVSRENALVVFAVTSNSVNFSRALAIDSMAIKAAEGLECEVLLPSLSSESKAVSEDEEVVLREQIIAGAVHAYLNRDGGISARSEQEKQLAQAIVIMAYTMVLLSAELRAQTSEIVAPEVQRFLDDLAPYILQALRYRGFCGGSGGTEHDIYDGHLLAVLVHHLRTTPLSELMDEDGLEDLNYSLQNIFGNEVVLSTDAPLAALPEVILRNSQEFAKEPRLVHELVESLAKRFNVRGHVANQAYPSDFGMANQLEGWALNYPFDDLNDVIDAKGQEEIQRNMTEKNRKRNMKIEAAFVIDATQQAESMGIRGFVKDRLALVVSESDDDSDDEGFVANSDQNGKNGDSNSSKRQKPTQQHHGQRNKKTRSKEDVIREETNLRDANRSVREWYFQVDSAIKSTDRATDRATCKDRTEAISTLSATITRLEQTNLAKGFDPGNARHKSEDSQLKMAMWRLLVETSGMREAEFAFTIEANNDPKKSKPVTRSKLSAATENLYAFNIIEKLVQDCTGIHGGANAVKVSSASANWGKIECLHHATQPPMSYYDAVSYLNWVYLTYVQLHFRLKLMCRTVKLQLDHWKVERERARFAHETPNIDVGIPLFLYCHHKVLALIQTNGLCISVDDIDTVRSALMHFDFPSTYYENMDQSISTWQGRPLGLLPPGMRPRQKMWFETPEMTQLMYMGHLLERPVIHEEDPRVAFNPDYWQRELLDIVDNRGSAVVCAPTSAGKTFISYYCMYKALKKSNRKVLVYLAPNRALINQAVADVCARYGSKKYSDDTKNVFGVHGGDDYHLYLDRCQVLVTLPEVLETILLSPKYTKWVENLNYVILDEIHTMESSGNGDVWERVLALLPCPFVALSATLGETHQLCGWLNRVQAKLREQQPHKKRDFNVYTVPSSGSIQRWNDIKKYIYFPPVGQQQALKKLKAKCEHHYIRDLHPLSILTLDQLQRGFPPDILLVPSEVVQLYNAMVAHFQKTILPAWSKVAVVRNIDAQIRSMKPEEYFKTELHITQQRARQYEVDVKNAFVYWVYLTTGRDAAGFDTLSAEEINRLNADMHNVCMSILHTFSFYLREEEEKLEKYAINAVLAQEQQNNNVVPTNKEVHFPNTKGFIQDNIINVLRELNSRDMGPTIVFTFESESCDDIVNTIVNQLEQAEAAYRQTEEFAQYRSMMERKAAAKEAARKQRESNLKQKRLTTDDGGAVERSERNTDLDDGDDDEDCVIPDVLPEFSFIGRHCTMDPETIQKAIEECKKRGDTLAARAISRGVGIHHAGVKGKLRRLMEILFRRRHCGVICSTETLALGIHSPCRSVVLAGDHVLLNTTQFRQMMGRAGRRGLDFLGHLVFLGVSLKKITRLMTSGMTVIKGNAQMDVISQLRLLKLHDFAEHRGLKNSDQWKVRVTAMAERLFVNPLFFEGRAAVEGGNMEGFTVELMQMLLWFFQKEGLHFKECPSSLGSLLVDALHVFRSVKVGVEGIAFIMMLTRGVFVNADFQNEFSFLNSGVFASTNDSGCTEALVELLAYLFSKHKMCGGQLEIHRSVLSDPVVVSLWNKKRRSGTARLHRVVLAPLRACCKTHSPLATAPVFRVISAFYTALAGTLQKSVEDRLPYMSAKTKKKSPIFSLSEETIPLVKKLRATAVPFKARTPFVAISGCGDNFVNTEDLMTTLRSGLFCDTRYLPVLDFVDGCRHDGAQVLINACVSDFARCRAQFDSFRTNYRFTLLEELNGLNQSECFAVLSQVENLLTNITGISRGEEAKPMKVLEELFPQTPDGYFAAAKGILHFAKHMHNLHWQIEKDYSVEQLLLKQMESRKQKV